MYLFSLPINFIYSTANPITSNDLTWLADYQSFNNFYTKTQSDAKYAQIQMMPGSKGYYLVCAPPDSGVVDNSTFYSNTPVIPNLQSCALYIGSNYSNISKRRFN